MFAAAAFLRFYRLDALPLGFHHDEGLDAISALEIWTKGHHPIFFPQQGSREPLMIYLESLGILALGATRLGARIMQAGVGTAGVIAAWFLFRDLFPRRVALLATGLLAVSFWQMFESRLGLRAISQPLFQTLCLLFFWRTLVHRRWLDAALAGALLGVTMYTYTASRALPLLMIALTLWQLAFAPAFLAKQWSRMLLVAGLGLLVFAPLGVYGLQHPDEFLGRSLQVSVIDPQPYSGADQFGGLAGATWRTLGMFTFQGDPEWKYNIGGQPVFDWAMSALFYGGLLLALLHAVRYVRTGSKPTMRASHPQNGEARLDGDSLPGSKEPAGLAGHRQGPTAQPPLDLPSARTRPPASPCAFVLLWLIVMLLPGCLSAEAPHFLRTIGILPALFAFPALALDWLVARWRWLPPLAAAFVLFEGVETYQRYFREWGTSPAAYYAMQADAADVAGWLESQPQQQPVLFSSEYPGHPTLLYLAPKAFDHIRWFNGRQSLALAAPGPPTLYVLPAQYQPPFLPTPFTPDQLVAEGHDPAGGVSYRVFRTATPPSIPTPTPLQADLAGLAQLQGVSLPSSVTAGQTFDVQEYWRAVKPGTPDLRAFVHLVDDQGHVWAQATGIGFYAEDWQPGDESINDQQLRLPAYAPPVPMKLLFGFFSATSGQQLPVRDAGGASVGTELPIGSIQVRPATAPESGWTPPHATSRQLAPGLTLAGWDLPRATVQAGESLPVSLFWQVTAPPASVPGLELDGVESCASSAAAVGTAQTPEATQLASSRATATQSSPGSLTAAQRASEITEQAEASGSAEPGTAAPAKTAAGSQAGCGRAELGLADLLPLDQWPVGGIIEDQRTISLPGRARAGIVPLSIGGVKLADVTITEPERDFSLPAMQHTSGLPVGGFATLAGYDVGPVQTGQPLKVTLVWQDTAPTRTSYKVFVHVLDGNSHVIAQRDDFPQAGGTPTTSWVPGQVVVDSYDVPLPASLPAGAQLEIGMYEPASGKRLTIGSDDRLLVPLNR